MNGGEQYSLDMALLKIREEKRKRKMRTERAAILFVVWLMVFRVCGIMRVDGNSMRPACHPGDIVFFLRILPDGVDYGDAVILKDASGEYLIKRIAGLPGDVMEVDREGHLTRNGAEVQETDVIYGLSETGDSVDYPYTVPEGSYFFLGSLIFLFTATLVERNDRNEKTDSPAARPRYCHFTEGIRRICAKSLQRRKNRRLGAVRQL